MSLRNHFHQLLTFRGNASSHVATIDGISLPAYKLRLLEPIKQTRYVGYLRDHALADFPPAEPVVPRAAKDAQDIVLRAGETEWPQCFVGCVIDDRGRPQQPEYRLVLSARERLGLLDLDLQSTGHTE